MSDLIIMPAYKDAHTVAKSHSQKKPQEAIPFWAQLVGGLWAFIIVVFFLRQILGAYLRYLGGG